MRPGYVVAIVALATACDGDDVGPDAGMPDASSFEVEPVCSSGEYWIDGEAGSPGMFPGNACIACHQQNLAAPRFAVAGTVYPTAHEPDDCLGATGDDLTIEITDAGGKVRTSQARSNGNFYLLATEDLAFPVRARVLFEGRVREMAAARTSGDCNTCHTQDGTDGAPGRILLP